MTPAELFDGTGRALFGDVYVAPMAALLNVEKNTVGEWRDGKSSVPLGVGRSIALKLVNCCGAIETVTVALAQHLKAEMERRATRG